MVTAASRGEGVTTIAINLAAVLAADPDGQVLLVDANLRDPAVHDRLGLSLDGGLGDWNGAADGLRFKPVDVARNLLVLTAGVRHAEGLAAVEPARLAALAKQARDRFDFVVWDSPPVVRYPDGVRLGTLVDGVLVVIEADRSRMDTLAVAREQLARAGTKVLGAVMNRSGRYYPRSLMDRNAG